MSVVVIITGQKFDNGAITVWFTAKSPKGELHSSIRAKATLGKAKIKALIRQKIEEYFAKAEVEFPNFESEIGVETPLSAYPRITNV